MRIGGGGAFQRHFSHHMFLPMPAEEAPPAPDPMMPFMPPPPEVVPPPAPDAPVVLMAQDSPMAPPPTPADPFAPPAPADIAQPA